MSEILLDIGFFTRSWVPILWLIAFFFGSIPFGLILGRIFRAKGAAFWPAGFLTLVLDFGKGILAVFLATPSGLQIILNLLSSIESSQDSIHVTTTWGAAFAVVLGHCFSPFLNFRGGKGVATTFGVLLFLSPVSAAIGILGFTVAFLYRRIISLASIAGLGTAAVGFLMLNPIGVHLWFGGAIALLVLIRHEKNIDALLENREKVFG